MPKDKDGNYYQCNYALSVPELMDIIVNAKDNTVVINGTQVSSKALANAIASVQKELRPAAQPQFPLRFTPRMHRPVRQFAFAR
jgi:histidine ammonia-lyase